MQHMTVFKTFSDIETGIRRMFQAPVTVAVTDPSAPRSAEYLEEAACLGPMHARRRREFLAGRAALRAAISGLGLDTGPIPMNPDRSPKLPSRVSASLSHSDRLCVAVADRDSESAALGIDIEPLEGLDPALWDTVCTRAERSDLATLPKEQQGLMAKRIFSAKEAAYKCQFALSGILLDFDAFDISFRDGHRFDAEFRKTVGPFSAGDRIGGYFADIADHIMTTARIPA